MESTMACQKCKRAMIRVGSRWTDTHGESVCPAGGLHQVKK